MQGKGNGIERPENDAILSEEASGDMRGPYGYGRPAHGSDPRAHYAFQPSMRNKSTQIAGAASPQAGEGAGNDKPDAAGQVLKE